MLAFKACKTLGVAVSRKKIGYLIMEFGYGSDCMTEYDNNLTVHVRLKADSLFFYFTVNFAHTLASIICYSADDGPSIDSYSHDEVDFHGRGPPTLPPQSIPYVEHVEPISSLPPTLIASISGNHSIDF